ncbi:proteasome maturation protein-like isoform X2 [Leptotrombidium deliense]|uniref:Proteasome maturation protein-like isoform X2 n=1 Tax=Leptotrombidium deliense TaxID=299467 RepID=A0A443S5C2_9ACAR|nr:proteasome maturation protein-like isoform X2 [Leptotrombidium deliense]
MELSKRNCFEENKVNPERNVLLDGFTAPRNYVSVRHPLEKADVSFKQRADEMTFSMLKNVQGVQAPLKLLMERRAASQVGRLPFMHSSNLMLDILEGNDDVIGSEDFLNDCATPEVMGPPHLVMERKLGIL